MLPRFIIIAETAKRLRQGVATWNSWRDENPDSPIDLAGTDLQGLDVGCSEDPQSEDSYAEDPAVINLEGVNLFGANLQGANLRRANLSGANLGEANLSNAILIEAHMEGCNLERADLRSAHLDSARLHNANMQQVLIDEARLPNAFLTQANLADAQGRKADLFGAFMEWTDLSRADLTGANLCAANLECARLVQTNLSGAQLDDAAVYGISAWDILADGKTRQSHLRIAKPGRSEMSRSAITVDDIEMAQFINLLVDHHNLTRVISAVIDKGVLVLGRFREQARKALLETIAARLRDRKMLPIIFNFERPTERDFTETVKTLAGLSSFVVADITNPQSVPLEAQAVVPDFMVPFVPILQKGQPAFSMLRDLQAKYQQWVLPVVMYADEEELMAVFDECVLASALECKRSLALKKAQPLQHIDARDVMKRRAGG